MGPDPKHHNPSGMIHSIQTRTCPQGKSKKHQLLNYGCPAQTSQWQPSWQRWGSYLILIQHNSRFLIRQQTNKGQRIINLPTTYQQHPLKCRILQWPHVNDQNQGNEAEVRARNKLSDWSKYKQSSWLFKHLALTSFLAFAGDGVICMLSLGFS